MQIQLRIVPDEQAVWIKSPLYCLCTFQPIIVRSLCKDVVKCTIGDLGWGKVLVDINRGALQTYISRKVAYPDVEKCSRTGKNSVKNTIIPRKKFFWWFVLSKDPYYLVKKPIFGRKLGHEDLLLHRLLARVPHNSCCYATMQHLMTSFCNIWWHYFATFDDISLQHLNLYGSRWFAYLVMDLNHEKISTIPWTIPQTIPHTFPQTIPWTFPTNHSLKFPCKNLIG